MTPDLLDELAGTWAVALRDAGKAPNTARTYAAAVRSLAAWQREHGKDGFSRAQIRGFIGGILDQGGARNTGRIRAKALIQFSRWLAAEGITGCDELAGMEAPKPGDIVVPRLSDADVSALLAACAADDSFCGARDEAFVSFATDVPVRIQEMLWMDLPGDLDLIERRGTLRRTKGNHERRVAFSAATQQSIARYLSMRARLADPGAGPLWISMRRRSRLGYRGLYESLSIRAEAAGITGFFPYRLRNTAAVRYLLAGGSEGNLMMLGGWQKRDMLDHYVAEARAEIALAEADSIYAAA